MSDANPAIAGGDPPIDADVYRRICEAVMDIPVSVAIESELSKLINSGKPILWVADDGKQMLYGPTVSKAISFTKSLVGRCRDENMTFYSEKPEEHESFDSSVDFSDIASMYIPVVTKKGVVVAVLQILSNDAAVGLQERDRLLATSFIERLASYAHLLFVESTLLTLANSFLEEQEESVLGQVIRTVCETFECRKVDFFSVTGDGGVYVFNCETGRFKGCHGGYGVVMFATEHEVPLIVENVKNAPGYHPDMDGDEEEPVVVMPIAFGGDETCALVMRGRADASKRMFSGVEIARILSVGPEITMMISGGASRGQDGEEKDEHEECDEEMGEQQGGDDETIDLHRMPALLEAVEVISGNLDSDELGNLIVEKCGELVSCEQCVLFIVDTEHNELIGTLPDTSGKKLRLPLTTGIAGVTVSSGSSVSLTDPYSDSRFDDTMDRRTGLKTKTLMTTPIMNNRGDIIGVTKLINKTGEPAFSEQDMKTIGAFNVFCGIAMDNAKLYQGSLSLTRQLREMVDMSLTTTDGAKDVLTRILNSAASVIGSQRGLIYLYNIDTKELTDFVSIGEGEIQYEIFAKRVIHARQTKVFNKHGIDARLPVPAAMANPPPLSRINSVLGMSFRRHSIGSVNSCAGDFMDGHHGPDFEQCIAIPLMTDDGKILGVMELTCPSKITIDDEKLLNCFSVFAAVSLEKSELKDIATLGRVEHSVKQYITYEERCCFDIPQKLVLEEHYHEMVFTNNFDAPMFDGIGHFKVLWLIYSSFGLLEKYAITNEKFFRFLTGISETYKKVPYHNWRHAVDVTQFVQYEVRVAKMDEILKGNELLGLFTAAVCHDANHDGFTNVYNERAETPLGILFKDNSVMETHHCTITIGVISNEATNIFAGVDSGDYKALWSQLLALILATDMAKHFSFLKTVNELVDQGPLDMENSEHRLICMTLILKCADISNVSRPFDMANMWCDVLCEEFFRQGDLEMAHGMEYTSPLNDRAHLDKPKSQIGFYTFVCLPLYETTARVLPALDVNVKSVMSNLATWKGEDGSVETK